MIVQNYLKNLSFTDGCRSIFVRDSEHYAVIDGVRAITILMVVLFHCLYGIVKLLEPVPLQAFINVFPEWLNWAWQARGSDCLFVVCGFLLVFILAKEYEKYRTVDVKRFYRRRLLRIIPLFIPALALYLAVDWERNLAYLWSNLLFVTNIFPGQRNIIPVGWSLVIQIHFYLVAPLLVLWLYKSNQPLVLLTGLFVLAFAVRYAILMGNPVLYETPIHAFYLGSTDAKVFSRALYYNTLARMGPFVLGAAVAYGYVHYGDWLKTQLRHRLWMNLLILLLAVALLLWVTAIPIHNPEAVYYTASGLADRQLFYLTANRNIFSFAVSLILLLALSGAGISTLLQKSLALRIWYPVARLIYPIYLFHFPFIVVAAVIVFGTTEEEAIQQVQTLDVFLIFIWAVLFTMLFSIFVYIFLEKPFTDMRE